MKVLIFSHEFPPYLGGVGSVAAQLANFLVAQECEVHVLTREQLDRQDIPGVIFHDVVVMPKLWFLSYQRYISRIDLTEFDAIILNEAAPTVVAGKCFDESCLAKSVVLVHGLEVETIYRTTAGNWVRRLAGFRAAHERACLLAKDVAVASHDIRQKFLEANRWPDHKKIAVRYLGADGAAFYPEESDYRQQRGISATDFLLVSGSRIVAEKGYGEMLQTFAALASENPSLKWVVCGDGDYLDQLKSATAKTELTSSVLFEGGCSKEKLRWIYNDCNAFWLISNYREAFPLAYIEAQLTGLPTFGRDYGGVREAINVNTGWLVDQASDLEKLLPMYIKTDQFNKQDVAKAAQRFAMDQTLPEIYRVLAS